MKKANLFLALLFLVTVAHAGDYYPQTDEWPIPRGIHTQADVRKYEHARGVLIWSGAAVLAGAVGAGMASSAYGHKAAHFPVYGPVISVPVAGTGGQAGVQTFLPGALTRQNRYRSKQAAFRQGAIAGVLLGALLLGVSLSLRF